jgi:hypothetical protein
MVTCCGIFLNTAIKEKDYFMRECQKQINFMAIRNFKYRTGMMRGFYATIAALCWLVLVPLPALACGGLFTAQGAVDQSIERMIFAVDPGKVTLYEEINYSGTASNFAWVLPVMSVPTIETAPMGLFSNLDRATAPTFVEGEAPRCGFSPNFGGNFAGAPAPQTHVSVYGTGTVGPYAYNVIGSSDPQALVKWLQSNHYHVPDSTQALIQPYVQAHMKFLALRLQPSAGVQDITPVKLTESTSANTTPAQIMIPMRLAAVATQPHTGILVWIFAASRFVPQNYQSVVLQDSQFTSNPYPGGNYPQLVDSAVTHANGHAFITDYAQPTSSLYMNDPTELANLKQTHSYVTRLYTRLSADQMLVDPVFTAASGLPTVNNFHTVTPKVTCDPFNSWLGQVSSNLDPTEFFCCCILFIVLLLVGAFLVVSRIARRSQKQEQEQ